MILAEGKSAERKKVKGTCLVIGCTSPCRKHKGVVKSRLCCKHEHEAKKEKDPHKYWYGVLRRNARRRGKVFEISLEYFTKFCKETNYINLKGRKSGGMTIDRRIDELGYIEGNLQILEVGENTRKKYTDYWKHNEQTWTEPPIDTSDLDWPPKPIVSNEDPPF